MFTYCQQENVIAVSKLHKKMRVKNYDVKTCLRFCCFVLRNGILNSLWVGVMVPAGKTLNNCHTLPHGHKLVETEHNMHDRSSSSKHPRQQNVLPVVPLLWFQIPLKLSTTIQDLIGSEDCTAKIAAVAIQKTSATKNVPHSLHVLCPTMLEFSLPNLRHQFMRFFSLANGNDAVHVDVLARFQHGGPIRSRCSAICPMHAERTIQKANVANSDPNICETYTKS